MAYGMDIDGMFEAERLIERATCSAPSSSCTLPDSPIREDDDNEIIELNEDLHLQEVKSPEFKFAEEDLLEPCREHVLAMRLRECPLLPPSLDTEEYRTQAIVSYRRRQLARSCAGFIEGLAMIIPSNTILNNNDLTKRDCFGVAQQVCTTVSAFLEVT